MLGSGCFISPKLHVSKIKALFRPSARSGEIRAFSAPEGKFGGEENLVFFLMVCPKHTKSCWSWTSALSLDLTFINLLNQSQLFDKHLLTGFIARRGSRSVQSGLFLGRDCRWRRRLVSWYEESGALCVDELSYFCINPWVLTGVGQSHDLVLLWGLIDQQ